ncbi:MAG: glycosyltransferase [Cyanobacteria bacterium J06560_6]
MNVLMAHNRYQNRAGEDRSFDAESSLLEQYGTTVIRYIQDNKKITGESKLKLALRTIWSQQDYKAVRKIIKEEKIDVLHVQNHFPLISPSIYYAANDEGIPVVQSLRNYRLFCLNAYLFREGKVCENCLAQPIPWLGVYRKCYRDSLSASFVLNSSLIFHRLLKTYQKKVDLFIALTEFAKKKYSENGIPKEKIVLKPNFVSAASADVAKTYSGAIFVGRLSSEKGITTLLEAWKILGSSIPLRIVGAGPLEEEVRKAVSQWPGIEYFGLGSAEEVKDIMCNAEALIFPSLWYEGMPRVIVEAFSVGTPVISSNLGAMSTMITHKVNGLHFTAGDANSLIEQVRWMRRNVDRWMFMRKAARQQFERHYSAHNNYQALIEIYNRALQNKRDNSSS